MNQVIEIAAITPAAMAQRKSFFLSAIREERAKRSRRKKSPEQIRAQKARIMATINRITTLTR